MSVRYGFDGQVAVITGAANGVGLAVAERLAADGAVLVLVDRDASALEAAASKLSGLAVVADVSVESEVDGYVAAAVEAHGRIDLFFNNAGIEGRMASMAAIKGAATFSPYIASKHAVLGLTKSAALEGAPFGIRVNCVAPGHIDTRMARDLTAQIDPSDPEGAYRTVAATVPLGKRYGTAGEVANVVTWLLSSESEYVSGALHLIDGALNA